MGELFCTNAIVKGAEGGGMGEDMRWQNSDLGVPVRVRVKVRSTREGVGTVSLPGNVY